MFSATMDYLPLPAFFVNKEGLVTEINKSAQKILGKRNSILGQSVRAVFQFSLPDGPIQLEMPIIDHILKGEQLLAESITLYHEKKPVNFILNTVALKDNDNKVKGVVCSLLQIPRQTLLKYKFEIVSSLTKTISSKCESTKSHSNRVAHLSLFIGIKMGLAKEQLQLLFLAALLHDIGKIGISEQILNKNGSLTESEFQIVKEHSLIGARIIYPISSLKPLAPIILYHHERYDGRGYPCGLEGEKIPLLSRIVSVADAFEAMTYDRCYRKKMGFEMAVEELINNMGTQFDPYIVKIFTANISNIVHPSK